MSGPPPEHWRCCDCGDVAGCFGGEPERCFGCLGQNFEPFVSGDDDIAEFLAPMEDGRG